jgi:hypothetical protein
MTPWGVGSYGVGTLEAVQTFLKRKANERKLIMASNARLRNLRYSAALHLCRRTRVRTPFRDAAISEALGLA